MAVSRLALIGCKNGPWIDISRIRRPILHVSGLKKGILKVSIRHEGIDRKQDSFLVIEGNGNFAIPGLMWLKVEADEIQHGLICEVFSDKVA
jgi:hypothetical protein